MRTRKVEVDAVVTILEDETYATVNDMAKDLLREVYKLWHERDFFGLRWGLRPYGPVADLSEANRAAEALQGLPTVHRLYSMAELDRVITKLGEQPALSMCAGCKHPTFAHGFTNKKGCIVRSPVACTCTIVYK